jgi:hypothetical protein
MSLWRDSALLALLILASSAALSEPLPAAPPAVSIDRICALIASSADKSGLPRDFFARLIWKESRFDHNAVSPVGAEGIAQFMPGTAKIVGLADPFDIEQAIPASAAYLARLHAGFGNWGLAAAAYNGGETRVGKWLSSGGFLPLAAKLSFDEACRKLPIIASRTVAMSRVTRKPWGIQVAGNFRQSAASKQWERVRRAHPAVLSKYRAVISRMRTPIGRRGIFAVRIGANSRAEADKVCAALRTGGGACIVTKNR